MALPAAKRKLPNNDAAYATITAALIAAMQERTTAEAYGELVLKINFTNGKIVQHRMVDEKIRKYDD